jgi:hypothetical protein
MSASHRVVLSALVALALCTPPTRAAAQEESPLFLAQKRFEAARQLYDAGDHTGALSGFLSSFALHPSPNTGLYIARALKHLGRLGEAVARYEAVVSAVSQHAERERYAPAAAAARAEARALEPRVARLTLTLPDAPPEATVRLGDGRSLQRPVKRLPLDPGAVELVLEAPGRPEVRRQLALVAGQHLQLEVRLTPPPATRPAAPATRPAAVSPPAAGPPAGARRTRRWLWIGGWSAAAAGAASLVASIVCWRLAQDRFDTLSAECGAAPCPPGRQGLIDEGRDLELATNVTLGVGAGLAATGAALLVVSLLTERERPVALGSDGSALLLGWSFD